MQHEEEAEHEGAKTLRNDGRTRTQNLQVFQGERSKLQDQQRDGFSEIHGDRCESAVKWKETDAMDAQTFVEIDARDTVRFMEIDVRDTVKCMATDARDTV